MIVTGAALQTIIRNESLRLGFDLCRFTPVSEAPHADFFDAWIDAGRAGEMSYLERNREKRRFPARLAEPSAAPFQTMVVLGVDYHQYDLPPALRDDPSRGVIASYAWGDDYHELIRPLLYELDALIRAHTGRTSLGKGLVDTGPVLERDWAAAAGLGFTGKNCCTIRPGVGSWLLLAVLLIPEKLCDPASAVAAGPQPAFRKTMTCGRCTRCLVACPTDAFVGAYDLDPQRCISYWTIESRSIIPRALRARFGNRIFGCDICQEVCPYNRHLPERAPLLAGLHAHQARVAPPLLEGFDPSLPYWLDQAAFSAQFARSPIKRAKRAGMLRNVCVALGNWADASTVPALTQALRDPEPVVRVHAAWATGRVLAKWTHAPAAALLRTALDCEPDARVRDELQLALAGIP
jgi:epoxyqueuosine reductase